MTLVELVVFMTLAMMVMGGLIPVITMAQRMDHTGEQRVAAFFYCKSILEELRSTPFQELASAKNGFKKQGNGVYERKVNDVPFHTQGGTKYTKLKAVETTTLVEGKTGDIPYYATTIKVSWNSNRGKNKDPLVTESLTTILYP